VTFPMQWEGSAGEIQTVLPGRSGVDGKIKIVRRDKSAEPPRA
jgi:hypothetical protein